MFPHLESKYSEKILAERAKILASGNFREKVRYDLINRPYHAFGLLAAADMAKFCGIKEIAAIEFGVASGDGLLNMCEVAKQVTDETGIKFQLYGFDTGSGLPEIKDYRDHPEIWSVGDFFTEDRAGLEAKLPKNASIIWGDIANTIGSFVSDLEVPVGFVSVDVDTYSSSVSCLKLFEAPAEKLLPVTVCYFDDTLGSPFRIGSLFRNRFAGQLLAIDEFNQQNLPRKLDVVHILKHRRPLEREQWLDQIYGLHVLDHKIRTGEADRKSLSIGQHSGDDRFAWPL